MNNREIVLILPDIRSCHNVGAMFRTADACGISTLYLVGYTATPPKIQIDKVSLGAEKWMPWEKRDDLPGLLTDLKEQGYEIVALEKNSESTPISNFKSQISNDAKIALIVGNEVDGVEENILSFCNHIVHIPMLGKKESLNVSIAAGIAMYALRFQ